MSEKTTDHEKIRSWVEERGGVPATVEETQREDDVAGILRIDFPDASPDPNLVSIPWEEFFDKFEESKLAFLYEDKTSDGSVSRFNKFVSRDT